MGSDRMELQPLLVSPERAAELKSSAGDWPSHDLTHEQVDLAELLLRGVFAPLRGFMPRAEARSAHEKGVLASGAAWPEPVVLEIAEGLAEQLEPGGRVALRDPEGVILAALECDETWVEGERHFLSGELEGLALPLHYDFTDLREDLAAAGGIALLTGAPLHRTEIEAAATLAADRGSRLTIYGLIGGDPRPAALVRLLRAALPHLPPGTRLKLLALDPQRENLRPFVARNLGASLVFAADNAGCDIETAPLAKGSSDDSFPSIAAELDELFPPPAKQGLTVFFTGLSGSGKSTIANILRCKLEALGGRKVTLLDGDLVRKNLSSELDFSKEHRNINILRIGFVAAEITKHGGLAICAPIAPYDAIRKQVRAGVAAHGGFVLVHVATPLEVCEARDRKGLYAMARAGKIKEFTGISDPYEQPEDAELVIRTTEQSAEEACDNVIAHLRAGGYL